MDRSDLLAKNGGIFKVQGEALARYAKKTVKVLVVGNPANTNCAIAVHYAKGLKPENFSAMTRLDHNRSLGEIAEKAKVLPGAVHRTIIWGNHSNTQVPDVEFAEVETAAGLKKVTELFGADYYEGTFVSKIATRGGAVIKARGASSAASAANAAIAAVHDWIWGTKYGEWVSMAIPAPAGNSYGITPGIIFSFPVTVDSSGAIHIVEGLKVSPFVQEKLKATEKELLEEKQTAWKVLSID
jgi:malate dehydrogenase